jgi:hypothetical protein
MRHFILGIRDDDEELEYDVHAHVTERRRDGTSCG